MKGENMKASEKYIKSLAGARFGNLVVLYATSEPFKSTTKWKCICDCGNHAYPVAHNLVNGRSTSCGCLRKKRASEFAKSLTRHGGTGTRLYSIWRSMICRCYYKNDKCYSTYGGAGITICDEWRNDFKAFRDWAIANGYKDHLSIDRIDVQKGYYPRNCRWATNFEQSNNKTSTVFLTHNGNTKPLTVWAQELGIPRNVLYSRIKHHGWSTERALSTPYEGRKDGRAERERSVKK